MFHNLAPLGAVDGRHLTPAIGAPQEIDTVRRGHLSELAERSDANLALCDRKPREGAQGILHLLPLLGRELAEGALPLGFGHFEEFFELPAELVALGFGQGLPTSQFEFEPGAGRGWGNRWRTGRRNAVRSVEARQPGDGVIVGQEILAGGFGQRVPAGQPFADRFAIFRWHHGKPGCSVRGRGGEQRAEVKPKFGGLKSLFASNQGQDFVLKELRLDEPPVGLRVMLQCHAAAFVVGVEQLPEESDRRGRNGWRRRMGRNIADAEGGR